MKKSIDFIKEFETAGSHFEIGLAIGQRFAEKIDMALDAYRSSQEKTLAYQHSPKGQAMYQKLVDLNRARYPGYFAELEGIAQGARRPFEDLFLVSMRGEYRGYLSASLSPSRGCFDCSLLTDDAALIGHNEDGSPVFRENIYIIHARPKGKPAFTTLSYPGFLCGNAFGFNNEGICFSIDSVSPQNIRAGIGRNFIARSLLEARSLQDAIERVTIPGRASGFNYIIGSIPERRIVQVEVAPQNHHIREIRGVNLHANHYLELKVEQKIGAGSRARVEHARALLQDNTPSDAGGVLSILGDQTGNRYPIYRTATPPDPTATLCTALFDLDAPQLQIYSGHPLQDPEKKSCFAM